MRVTASGTSITGTQAKMIGHGTSDLIGRRLNEGGARITSPGTVIAERKKKSRPPATKITGAGKKELLRQK